MTLNQYENNWEKIELPTGEFWKPIARADSVQGILKQKREGQYGAIFDIELENGNIITIPNLTVLSRKLGAVDQGKEVKIVFMGETKGKSGRLYKDFDVFVKKETGETIK